LERLAIVIGCIGKIPAAFGGGGHASEKVVGSVTAASVPSGETKPFVATIENFGNVDGAADVGAESGPIVLQLGLGDSAERVGGRVKLGVIVGVVHEAVRLIATEAASTHAADSDRATAAHAAWTGEAFLTLTGPTTKAVGSAPVGIIAGGLHAVAKFIYTLLAFVIVAIAEVLCVTLGAADADGFGGNVDTGAVERGAGEIGVVLCASAWTRAAEF